MTMSENLSPNTILDFVTPERHVLIAGPTASGKSSLALQIAQEQGGVIVNADASQVYDCWRILTARPSPEEEAKAEHALYGHVSDHSNYSTGHWLRDIEKQLARNKRLIVVGGTGLYFSALTRGLADIPPIPPEVRAQADETSLPEMLDALDAETRSRIDAANRARVQRAWEVLTATGRGIATWQDETGPPLLPLDQTVPVVFKTEKTWLNERIARRFDIMMSTGVLDEVRRVQPSFDPKLPAHRAIGAPELMAYLQGRVSLDEAIEAAVVSTRQFAKRQRTWFRSKMAQWHKYHPDA